MIRLTESGRDGSCPFPNSFAAQNFAHRSDSINQALDADDLRAEYADGAGTETDHAENRCNIAFQ